MVSDLRGGCKATHRVRVGVIGYGLVALACVAVASVYACSTAFSYFSSYDDQGYAMITVRGFLEGHRLYTDIFTYYGPFYYLYEWFVHSVLAIPLTHDATTALCVLHWLIASCLLALAGGLLTRSKLVGFLVFMQASLHLTPLAREPGHPQELVAVLLSLAAVIAARGLHRRWALALMAGICVALVFTKINVGLFLGFALALALTTNLCRRQRSQLWFWPVLIFSALLPFALMRPNLGEGWALVFSVQASLAILSFGMMAHVFGSETEIPPRRIIEAGIVMMGTAVLLVLIALMGGMSFPAFLQTVVKGPSSLGTSFSIPLKVPLSYLSAGAAMASACAVMLLRRNIHRLERMITASKAAFAVVGLVWMLTNYNRELGYLLPWSWLVLVPAGAARRIDASQGFTRAFLVMLAVWQSLQAYPVAGTQAVVGSMLLILIYALCLHDAVSDIAAEPRLVLFLRGATPKGVALAESFVCVGLLYVFAISWCNPFSAWRYYTAMTPLGLSGAEYFRLPEDQVRNFRALTRYLANNTDAFYTIPGFNSLYFWAQKAPPTYLVIPEALLLSGRDQDRVIASLTVAKQPLLVLNGHGLPHRASAGPLAGLIRNHCRTVQTIGGFQIVSPRGVTPDYTGHDVTIRN